MEIVMAVPFQTVGGNSRIVLDSVDNSRHASGERHLRERHAVAHRVAGADFDGDSRFVRDALQFVDKREHEAVKIRAG